MTADTAGPGLGVGRGPIILLFCCLFHTYTHNELYRTHISLEWIPVLDTSLEWIFTPRGPGTGELCTL